jgi:hypothetical protein
MREGIFKIWRINESGFKIGNHVKVVDIDDESIRADIARIPTPDYTVEEGIFSDSDETEPHNYWYGLFVE